MELSEAVKAHLLRLTRPTWPPGQYVELELIGGFLSPMARLRSSILEAQALPSDVERWDPTAHNILIYDLTAHNDWEAYTGPLAPPLEDA